MKENTVVAFQNPSDFQKDPLTEVLQAGARELLAQAVEAEVSVFLGSHAALVDAAGRRRVVRNGYLPERFIQTGIGPVSVRQPRVRDRGDGAIRFTSAILPRYLRRAKSLEDLLPWLYLKGISTGDFGEALAALLGSSAPGLSASTITRLKEVWGVEAERWQRRDLTAKRYVYFWVDGIYFSARMEEEKQCILVIVGATDKGQKELEEEKQCILVIVGATDKGQKELIAIADGYRESEQSWLEVLLDLKRRGLEMGPQLALGDGALGFWKALRQVYPGAREQRCWVHKTGNVLNKLPKGLQKKAKGRLQDIWMAETRKDAESAFDFFLEAYGPKYDKAAACLAKDRDVLLTFYDFPAEHWKHVRTTNPIESTFATVRLRTYRTKGCLSRKTAMAMVFKLCQCGLPDQGLPVAQDGDGHGLQTMPVRSEKMEKTRWIEPSRRDHSRRQIRRWRTPGSRRRMISPYTTFDNSSAAERPHACAPPSIAGQVPAGLPAKPGLGKTWTSQARPHLPQAHQQQLSSQNYRSCSGPPWTLRLSQFCVQGNRVRLSRNEAGIAVGKCHDEKMRPLLDAGDDRIRRAKVRLSMARRMGQRHKHLTPTKAPFPNVILHDGLFAREAMFVAKALEDTLRRVVLLTVNRSVLLQNTVDDIREGGQFRAFRWLASPISRRFRMPQHLPHRRARKAKPTCRLSLAQTITMAGQPNAQI